MESHCLYLKPKSLSLITCAPISLPLFPRQFGPFRSEFMGCSHNLRLPRRKCKRSRFKSHALYLKCLFRASLESQPVPVVTAVVAAASAIAIVYLTYFKKQFDIKKISGRVGLALSEQIRTMSSWMLNELRHVDLRKEATIDKNKELMKQYRESSKADTGVVAEIEHMAVDSSDLKYLASRKSEIAETSSVPSEHSGSIAPHFVMETSGVYFDAQTKQMSVDLEMSVPVIETHTTPTFSAALHVDAETDEIVELHHELRTSFDLLLKESAREELYTINKTSVEELDNLGPLPSCATLEKNIIYPSLMKHSSLERSNYGSHDILHSGKLHLGYSSLGFSSQQDSETGKDPRKKNRLNFRQRKPNKFIPSSGPNGKDIANKHNPPWQLRVYNQLVREGRLSECIELLEDLEGNGLLDMNKVYHVRFFDLCKSKKTVQEAFRFARLIPNPTLSTFNMLMSVCACTQDSEGAFEVLKYVQEVGLSADCKLYTTLISTCAKSGKVDAMFKVFHDMVNAGVEPNVHTYGALIDGCAKAGQVAKAFGAYGILLSKNVKPDRVVFNALITACGQSGAVDRAFDVLAEMRAEMQPIDPDHITIGALMKACGKAGQVDRAREVYNMIHKFNIRGTAELYTIAVNSCSHHGDWEFACSVYDDMIKKGVAPDEMFISALIDVAGHAGKVDAAFEILEEAKTKGLRVGIISYSSLMGACSNAKDWRKALELYEGVKGLKLKPTVPMMNALITALCDSDQLQKAMETLFEMKGIGLCPNTITYSILVVASEKNDDLEAGLMLISQAKKDKVTPNLVMCRCLIAMCWRRFQKASSSGEPVLSFTSGQGLLNTKWTSLGLMVYRETITAGTAPTMAELSLVLGCLQLPHDASVRKRLVEFLGINTDTLKGASVCSRIDGFGEYDPRAFSLVEEAASLGVVPFVSLKEGPILVDLTKFQLHTAEVYLLTVLKGLKHRLAAGAKLPNITILLPMEESQIQTSAGEKTVNVASRISQAVAAMLRRLELPYQGNGSYGKIRIKGVILRQWFQPKLDSPFGERTADMGSSLRRLGSGLSRQRRNIRTGHLSLQ